jgi:hypothetical protein
MSAVVRCARCGHTCPAEVWSELPLEQTLGPQHLATYVSTWPADVIVQIRACRGCGGRVARTARQT